jgi:hypothetical protein
MHDMIEPQCTGMRSNLASVSHCPPAVWRPGSVTRSTMPKRRSTISNTQSECGNAVASHHYHSDNAINTADSQSPIADFARKVRSASCELIEEAYRTIVAIYKSAMRLVRLLVAAITLVLAIA